MQQYEFCKINGYQRMFTIFTPTGQRGEDLDPNWEDETVVLRKVAALGTEGWQLVTVLQNDVDTKQRDFYFQRLVDGHPNEP